MSQDRETIQELEKSCTFVIYQADLIRVPEADLKAPANFQAGAVIDNKYRILGLLGLGGMGAVYRVKHLGLDKEVALKTFISQSFSKEAWQRFEREARAIARLDHENIIKVLDFGVAENNLPYYTMELVPGESLADRLRRTGPLSLPELLYVLTRLADALEHTHKREILHRDLKPGNVYLELREGQIQNIKLADFGIASLANQKREEQALTAKGAIFGSPLYMSPEQTRGETLDQRSDIYALGCVLFECAMGFPPYHGDSALATIIMHQTAAIPAIDRDDLPEWLHALYLSMMQKEREKRLPDLSEIMDILAFNLPSAAESKAADSKEEKTGRGGTSTGRNNESRRANPAPIMVSIAASLVLAALAAINFIPAPHKQSHPPKVAANTAVHKAKEEPLLSWHRLPEKPGKILINFPQREIAKITYSRDLTVKAQGPVEVDTNYPVQIRFTGTYPESAEELALLPAEGFRFIDQGKQATIYWDDSYFKVLSRFHKLEHLEVYDAVCTPISIDYLNRLPLLQKLRLRSSNLEEESLLKLKKLAKLDQLCLSGFKISPKLIRALGQNRISVIDLRVCRLEPGVFEALCKLRKLRYLELQDTSVSLTDLKRMQAEMIELYQLKLLRTGLSEAAVPILLQFKNLHKVEVPDQWSEHSVSQLKAKMTVMNK